MLKILYKINKKNTTLWKRLSFRENGLYQVAMDFALIKLGTRYDEDNRPIIDNKVAAEMVGTLKEYTNSPVSEAESFPRVLFYLETTSFIATGQCDIRLVQQIKQEPKPVRALLT